MQGLHHRGRFRAQNLKSVTKAAKKTWQRMAKGWEQASGPVTFEAMEGRQLLSSVELNSGVLTLTADTGRANDIAVWVGDNNQMWPTINGTTKTISTNQVSKIVINTGSSSDKIYVDPKNYAPVTTSNSQWDGSSQAASGGSSSSTGTSAGVSINNGALTIVGNPGVWNDIAVYVSSDGGTVWASLNGKVTTYSSWQFSSVNVVKGTSGDNVVLDQRLKVPTNVTTASASNNTGGSTGGGTTTAPTTPGITLSNGVLNIVGNAGQYNDIQVWISSDGASTWATLNGNVTTYATSQYSSVNIVKGTSGDKVTLDQRLKVPANVTTASGSTGGGSTGGTTGGSTTAPTTAGISISNGVLYIVGDTSKTNDIQLWVSSDGGTVWPTLNGQVKTYASNQFSSVQIVKGTANDKVTVDQRLKVPANVTTASGSTSGGSTGGSTGGGTTAPTTAGITVSNGVLYIVGNPGAYNDIQFWVSDDGNTSWPTLNGQVKTFATNQFNSIQIVQGTTGDKVYVDKRWTSKTTITGGSSSSGSNTGSGTGTGGSSGGGSTWTPPPSSGPNPQAVITMISPTSIIAGQSVSAQALNSVLNAGSQTTAKYDWDFGDGYGKYNKLTGYNAAHVYDTPGTYTLSLRVTNESGGTSTVTQTINVASDNRAAIYVDANNGNDSNNGSSPSQAVRSIPRLQQLLGDNKRVFFARGQTFYTDKGIWAIYANVTLDAYGSGADPILKWNGPLAQGYSLIYGSAAATKNLMVQNLQFDVSQPWLDNNPDGFNAFGTNVAIRNCTFIHINTAINGNGKPTGMLVQDNKSPNPDSTYQYFVWIEGSDAVILGNTVANSMRQHDIRAANDFNRALIAFNDLTNLDRRNSGDPYDFNKTTINIQRGMNVYVRGNTLTGGSLRLGPLDGADGISSDPYGYAAERLYNAVAENNTVNGTDIELYTGLENSMVRNNVVHFDDHAAIDVAAKDSMGRQVVNVSIVNNTGVNNAQHGQFLWVAGDASGLVLDNNLYVCPNMDAGGFQTAPVFVQTGSMSMFREVNGNVWQTPKTVGWGVDGGVNIVMDGSSMTGYKTPDWWNNQYNVGTDAFSGTQIGWDNKPAGGTVAATYGKKVAGVFDDFYGVARPTNGVWSAGAVQA